MSGPHLQNQGSFDHWPAADRTAWQQACIAADDPLADHSRIAAWSSSTRRAAFSSNSNFIRWFAAERPLPPDKSFSELVDRQVLVEYIKHATRTCKLATVRSYIFHIIAGLEVFGAGRDWKSAWQLYWRLKARADREPPEPRAVMHGRLLYELGVRTMRDAWPVNTPDDARQYRNGFAVALLAAAPMRIANFSALRIGDHLHRDDEKWSIVLAAAETKTQASDAWLLGTELSEHLDRYLHFVRPALLSADATSAQTPQLWIGDGGHSVGPQIVRRWINRLTEAGLGIRISPHSFRHCAATTYSVERPSRSVEASSLLGHASAATTERNYIIQQRQIAQTDYLDLLRARRRQATRSSLRKTQLANVVRQPWIKPFVATR